MENLNEIGKIETAVSGIFETAINDEERSNLIDFVAKNGITKDVQNVIDLCKAFTCDLPAVKKAKLGIQVKESDYIRYKTNIRSKLHYTYLPKIFNKIF